ncbi:molybdopterin molybdotransferase MoeA [Candidatus Levibacter sp. Uisw_134_01]|uniref:molybdopterin molybdotransferase MoeA n=1 Tax=Candidatus Levibacter sp. Uisw_134_01 TaxID=3230999 RepID=UPI003D4CA8AE
MPASKLISLDVAIRNIKSNFKKISNEDVFLQNSLGRCLAKPIYSKIDNPKYDVSSMDGYAINFKDFTELKSENNSKKAINFKVIGESSAGNPFEKKIKNFEAVRVFTGAKVPRGCDVVIIQENVHTSSDQKYISTQSNVIKYQNIRKKGLDFKKGECIFKIGSLIKSRHIGSIAMTGQTWVTVSRKPVVSILSTGNEILRVGEQLTKDQIPSGNNLMLAAMVTQFGGIPRILPIADDNEDSIYNILNKALDSDLIVTTGGVSVGKYDLIQKALQNFEGKSQNEFWKVAMRPGKPLLFSIVDNTPLIGLPGNPVSSGVCSLIFVNVAIRSMLGITEKYPIFEKITLDGTLPVNDERMDFVRAKINIEDGNLLATPINKQDSSMITQFSYSDCLIVRDPFEGVKNKGEIVKILRFPNNI